MAVLNSEGESLLIALVGLLATFRLASTSSASEGGLMRPLETGSGSSSLPVIPGRGSLFIDQDLKTIAIGLNKSSKGEELKQRASYHADGRSACRNATAKSRRLLKGSPLSAGGETAHSHVSGANGSPYSSKLHCTDLVYQSSL